jgi:hypothetical protein
MANEGMTDVGLGKRFTHSRKFQVFLLRSPLQGGRDTPIIENAPWPHFD